MSTKFRPLVPITHQRDVYGQPVTTLSFDPVSDILWAGSNTGTVVAYYGTLGTRGVSFRVGGNLAVKKIIAGESHVNALGMAGVGVGSWTKGGTNKWFFPSPSPVTTFSNNSSSSSLLAVSTAAPELLLLNSLTGSVQRQVPTASMISHLQFSHSHLLSGSSDGYLRIHDPRTGMRRESGEESGVKAHTSGFQDLQCSGNFAFTIGLSLRQSRPFPDPLVKVYDLRKMRPLPPVPFSAGPTFINVIPRRPSSIAITSSQGLVNIVDVSNASTANEFYQLDMISYLTSAAISPSGAYMAFGDEGGTIHLITAADEDGDLPFNGFDGQPYQWADTPEPLPLIDWKETTPLNCIGLPYYDTQLLSAWSPQFMPTDRYYPPATKLPPQILSTMKMKDNVAYAALPKELKGRRNVAPSATQESSGRFISGKSRGDDDDPESPTSDYDVNGIPKAYRQTAIVYSRFGVADFDFGFYNKTEYSGLESSIQNSYTNALVQVMHYSKPIRQLAKSHITTNCPQDHCLLCELGFVARMLEQARGIHCHSSNFCKTVGVLAGASNAIELIDYGREVDYSHMIQSFHRFLVDHLTSEGNAFPHNPVLLKQPTHHPDVMTPAAAPITQLLGIDAKNIITCLSCKATREKENMTHIVDMIYPRKTSPNEPSHPTEFAPVLRHSLLRQMTHKATCQTCKQFSSFSSRRSIPSCDLPPLLAVNACVYTEETFGFWLDSRHRSFLQPRIEIQGQVDGLDDPETAPYEVRAMVVQIVPKEKRSHLVAIVKVPEAEGRSDLGSPWFLFNDFSVRNIPESEALSFPGKWKVPVIVYLERIDVRDRLDFSELPTEVDEAILCRDTSISLNRDSSLIRHEYLGFDELPKPGTLVAIDAEFVMMQQGEMEFRSDRSTKVLLPPRQSVARVSVLRGSGPKRGVPFIDDHIHLSEPVVNFLTEYSGIKFGDLDPLLSRYTLTPLKLVYKKLRLLVDRGCIFVGHDLSNDFRAINIFVPADQVIDTVDLYRLEISQRRVSLRFLSWLFLHENIQNDVHDSIEDARSALKLYEAYQEFEDQGIFDQKLKELYKEGRKYNWKPLSVGVVDSSVAPTALPSERQPAFLQGTHPLDGAQSAFSTIYPHARGSLYTQLP